MTNTQKKSFSTTLPMMWGDMDAQGHLNNVQYFRYCEQTRAEWLRHIGFPLVPNDKLVLLVVNTSCTYLRPIHYPADITIKMYLSELGRTSATLTYEFFANGDFSTCYAEASSKIVCFDPVAKKPVAVPEMFRKHF
jgi:acyl-CoA thioester hydrolase